MCSAELIHSGTHTPNPGNVFGFYFGQSHVTQTCFFIFLFYSIHSLSMTTICLYFLLLNSEVSPPARRVLFLCIRCFVDQLVGRLDGRSVGMFGRHLFACVSNNTESPFQDILYAHLFAQAMNFDLYGVAYSIYSFLMQ